jgi:hypothetical protein
MFGNEVRIFAVVDEALVGRFGLANGSNVVVKRDISNNQPVCADADTRERRRFDGEWRLRNA